MTTCRSKVALMEAIQTEHQRLGRLLRDLSKSDMQTKGVVGEWSVKDVLAHLTAWERLLMDWYNAGLTGKYVSLPEPVGMSKKAIDALNQSIFEQNKDIPYESVWKDYQENYRRVLASLEQLGEESMFVPGFYGWTGHLTLADYVAGNTCNHYSWARTKIRVWTKSRR